MTLVDLLVILSQSHCNYNSGLVAGYHLKVNSTQNFYLLNLCSTCFLLATLKSNIQLALNRCYPLPELSGSSPSILGLLRRVAIIAYTNYPTIYCFLFMVKKFHIFTDYFVTTKVLW